MSVSAAVSL